MIEPITGKQGKFEDCPPVYELRMSDDWDKEDEIDVLHELGKEDW